MVILVVTKVLFIDNMTKYIDVCSPTNLAATKVFLCFHGIRDRLFELYLVWNFIHED